MNLLHPLLVFLASLTQQELARQVVFLQVENCILRSRLPGRVIATPLDKSCLIKLGRELGGKLRELISIVSYATFRRSTREAEATHIAREPPPNQPVDLARPVISVPGFHRETRVIRTKMASCQRAKYDTLISFQRSASEQPVRQLPHRPCAEFQHLASRVFTPRAKNSRFSDRFSDK